MPATTAARTREGVKAVELLHLAFLQVLATQVDPASYVVKGGANLRLFYDSPRRSQDIDLDYLGDAGWALEERVDRVLASRVLRDLLRLAGITMAVPSKPKQTETTRRWKLTVSRPGGEVPTKIEFSARHRAATDVELAILTPPVGRAAGLRAIRVQHYKPAAATRQKIVALAERSQTEPRDVFDLDLLLARFPGAVERGDLPPATVQQAIRAAFSIDYAAYNRLVIEYLEERFVPIYGRREVWEEMVLKVTEALEGLVA